MFCVLKKDHLIETVSLSSHKIWWIEKQDKKSAEGGVTPARRHSQAPFGFEANNIQILSK